MILLEFQINYVQGIEQNVEETRLTTFIKAKLNQTIGHNIIQDKESRCLLV